MTAPVTTLFAPGERIAIVCQTVTQAQCDAVAAMACTLETPERTRMDVENPEYPWELAAPLDAPGMDCAVLDAARTPRQEQAA